MFEESESNIDLKRFTRHRKKSLWSLSRIVKLIVTLVLMGGLYYAYKLSNNASQENEVIFEIEVEREN